MAHYNEHFDADAPSTMHTRRARRKFSMHKLARAVGHQRFQRNHKK